MTDAPAELELSSAVSTAEKSRRASERFPFKVDVHVVPLNRDGEQLHSESFSAVGKDISTNGIAISHVEPMRHSRVILTAIHNGAIKFSVEASVAWTRSISRGVSESGLKLIRRI
jgi:PilZ domain